MLPESLLRCLALFENCFTAPSYERFVTLMRGWIICVSKRTVTGVMRAAGVVGEREHSGFHRFFSRARWEPDALGLALLRLVMLLVDREACVTLALDDTLARHTGKHIAAAGMHRDPLLSCQGRPFWHFGHNWIVLAVVIDFPRWKKCFSLPVLARLYRTEKINVKIGRPHRKLTELAYDLLELVSTNFPKRRFVVVADNNYVNRSVVRPLPANIDLVGRGRMDAALYEAAPVYSGRGRPRVRGAKVASPKDRRVKWKELTVSIYGRESKVQIRMFDAVWYVVSYRRTLRFVVVRGWPGHDNDDVIVSTDLELNASDIIVAYCKRWSLEETFGWVKSRLGFEDPHNRTERAVERTAPMALWAYSITIVWYMGWARGRAALPTRAAPWYREKLAPSFADMLATLRRSCWTLWLSDQARHERLDQKQLEPLLDAVSYG